MKTNKINVVLSLNKQTVTKLGEEDRVEQACGGSVHGYYFSIVFMGTGAVCKAKKKSVHGACTL